MIYSYQKTRFGQWMPLFTVRLEKNGLQTSELALVDSGAGVNVLPHHMGLELGLNWENYKRGPNLTGNASGESKAVELDAMIQGFEVVKLSFAWSVHSQVRFILGQDDFFQFFHVCFFGDRKLFSLKRIEGKS